MYIIFLGGDGVWEGIYLKFRWFLRVAILNLSKNMNHRHIKTLHRSFEKNKYCSSMFHVLK